MNRNWHNDHKDPHREGIVQTAGVMWKYVNRDFSDVGLIGDTVVDDMWDNGGTVEAILGSGNAATIQRLYQAVDDTYWVLWGQEVYSNAQEAASRINSPVVVPPLLASAFLLGYIVVEKGKTDWDQNEAFFIQGDASGTGAPNVPVTAHNDLLSRDAADAHPITAIEQMANVAPAAVGDGIVWTGTEWLALNLWAVAAYGGIRATAPTALADIGAGWTTLEADAVIDAVPRGVVQDTAANTLAFTRAGRYTVFVSCSLTHNESNGSRETHLRIYDVNTAEPFGDTTYPIARNQPGTFFALPIPINVDASHVGDEFRIEIGGGDTLTGVTQNNFSFSVSGSGEYRG